MLKKSVDVSFCVDVRSISCLGWQRAKSNVYEGGSLVLFDAFHIVELLRPTESQIPRKYSKVEYYYCTH